MYIAIDVGRIRSRRSGRRPVHACTRGAFAIICKVVFWKVLSQTMMVA